MKSLKNLHAEMVSLENLYRATHATRARGRRYYGEGAWFSFHLDRAPRFLRGREVWYAAFLRGQ